MSISYRSLLAVLLLLLIAGLYWLYAEWSDDNSSGIEMQVAAKTTVNTKKSANSEVVKSTNPTNDTAEYLNDPKYLESLKTLGSREVKIDNQNTFIFLNGQYIPRPYTLRREGYVFSINNVEVFRNPVLPLDFQTDLPEIPDYIHKATSWKEIDAVESYKQYRWHNEVAYWYETHFQPPEAKIQFEKYVNNLPFVKETSWQEGAYHVVSHAGDARDFFSSWWDPSFKTASFAPTARGFPNRTYLIPYSEARLDWIRDTLENYMQHYEKLIRSGDIWVLNTPNTLNPYTASVMNPFCVKHNSREWKGIVYVAAILKSNASPRVKAEEVYPRMVRRSDRFKFKSRRFRDDEWIAVKYLVRNFRGHPQFDKRVAKMKKKYKIRNWKQPPEPVPPEIPESLKNDPRLTPEGTVREALRLLEAGKYQEFLDDYRTPPKHKPRYSVGAFVRNDVARHYIIALRDVQNKKPIIDDIDDIGYFPVDDSADYPRTLRWSKLRIRKIDAFWLIGY